MENPTIMKKSNFVFKFKLDLTSNIKNSKFSLNGYIMSCYVQEKTSVLVRLE